MRLALISDVHASLVPLRAVLADAEAMGADRVICLGDIVDMGPSPQETVDLIRSLDILCVRGNHDSLDEVAPTPMLQAVVDWTLANLDGPSREFLRELPLTASVDFDGTRVLCVHGSPKSNRDQFLASTSREQLEEWYDGLSFDVAVCGHTHVQAMRRLDERLLVNVGSVAQPFAAAFDGSPPRVLQWAEYVLLTSGPRGFSVDMRRIRYDFQAFMEELRATSFPESDAWTRQWSW